MRLYKNIPLAVLFVFCLCSTPVARTQQPPPGQAPPGQAPAGQAQPAQTAAQQAPDPVPIGSLFLPNANLTEVVDQLARALGITVQLDPRVKGSVILNTYGETRNLDARSLLDLILKINGAAMVQEGPVYRIVPTSEVPKLAIRVNVNAKDIPEDDQVMLNLVFLKYVTADELMKILAEFTGEYAVVRSYPPANLLFIMDNRRSMKRTMELIGLFDSDQFAGERVRLFEIKNTRPSDIVKDLENVLKAISLDNKTPVRFLPVDRIGTLIAVAPTPGVFETIDTWLEKLDVPVAATSAGTTDTYIYRVKYGRADCLAIAITQLFLPMSMGYPGGGYGMQGGMPYGMGGGYNPYLGAGGLPYGGGGNFGAFGGGAYGANPYNPGGAMGGGGGYGQGNGFTQGFGGTGGCGGGFGSTGYGQGYGTGFGGGYGGVGGGYPNQGYGYPTFGGYSAQTPLMGAGQPPAGQQTTQTQQQPVNPSEPPPPPPPRIVPNPLDNALLIQADPVQYRSILKLLKELDVPPRQILLESKVYQVDLTGDFSIGIQARFQAVSGTDRRPIANLLGGLATLQAGTLVGQTRELLAFLNLQENSSKVHTVSEPSLIATDSIPATINVGTQVPVLTTQTASPVQVGGTNTINQQIGARNTGVTLNVNARVNPSGVVTLLIGQEISKAASTSLTPSFTQQVVQTQITLQDGDTVAIGGIIAENGTETSSGIPGLSRIPVLGAAFGNRTYARNRTEFIIFMTPHVIYDTNDLLEASDELVARVRKLRKYMK